MHGYARRDRARPGHGGADAWFVTNQAYGQAMVTGARHGARHDLIRRVVASHRIERDGELGGSAHRASNSSSSPAKTATARSSGSGVVMSSPAAFRMSIECADD